MVVKIEIIPERNVIALSGDMECEVLIQGTSLRLPNNVTLHVDERPYIYNDGTNGTCPFIDVQHGHKDYSVTKYSEGRDRASIEIDDLISGNLVWTQSTDSICLDEI